MDVAVAEIVDFSEFLLPTLDEKAQRDAAMDSVRSVIQYIWPDCKVPFSPMKSFKLSH